MDPLKQKPDFKDYSKDPIAKWVLLFIVCLIIYGFFTT